MASCVEKRGEGRELLKEDERSVRFVRRREGEREREIIIRGRLRGAHVCKDRCRQSRHVRD